MNTGSLRRYCAPLLIAALLPGLAGAQPAAPAGAPAPAAEAPATHGTDSAEYLISPGDVLRISVFQSPELSLEARVDESGAISYPLIGKVVVGGSSVGAVEQRIAKMLVDGGFMVAPHVTITVSQIRGSQVTVLGQVGKPGRFPLDSTDFRVTDMIALAGGISPTGSDIVVLSGMRDGKPFRREIDLQQLANEGDASGNLRLQAGDMLFVNRAPIFYIYGEVQKPGAFRLEHGMTVMQALATGGGLTPKGTRRGLTIHRHRADGTIEVLEPKLDDLIDVDDVINVRESLF
jgi:polysaccharide export outer membrane protein